MKIKTVSIKHFRGIEDMPPFDLKNLSMLRNNFVQHTLYEVIRENMRYLKLVVLFIISNTISIYAQKGKAIFKDELVHELHIDFYDEYNGSNGNRWLDSLYKFHEIAGIEREYIDGVWIETEVKEKYLNARITFDASYNFV